MNPKIVRLIPAAAALAGIAAGWIVAASNPPPANPPPPLSRRTAPVREANPPPRTAAAHPADGLALTFPSLTTVADCREFIDARDATAAGRHPLLVRLERAFAFRRWLELDAEDALSEAERRMDTGFAGELFQAWLDLHPQSALDAFTQASPALTAKLHDEFFRAFADKDPAAAVAELSKPRWKPTGLPAWNQALRTAYEKWAQVDPMAAFAHAAEAEAKANPGVITNPVFAASVAAGWARVDPAGAWAFFREKIDAEDPIFRGMYTDVLSGILEAALGAGPAGARVMDDIRQHSLAVRPDADVKRRPGVHLDEIAQGLSREDPRAAMEWARQLPSDSPLRSGILGAAAAYISSSEPETTLAIVAEIGNSGKRDKFGRVTGRAVQTQLLIRAAFASLDASDPGRARELLAGVSSEYRSPALSGILTHAFATDPAAGIERTRAFLADPALRSDALAAWAIAFSWGHGAGVRDPGPSLAALPELDAAVGDYVVGTWVKADPEAAAGWIGAHAGDEDIVKRLGRGALAELATSRPEFTADWIGTLPDSPVRTEAAEALATNWIAFDPDAARAWIDSLPPGELQDKARSAAARR